VALLGSALSPAVSVLTATALTARVRATKFIFDSFKGGSSASQMNRLYAGDHERSSELLAVTNRAMNSTASAR